jgi:hypothetical protein
MAASVRGVLIAVGADWPAHAAIARTAIDSLATYWGFMDSEVDDLLEGSGAYACSGQRTHCQVLNPEPPS